MKITDINYNDLSPMMKQYYEIKMKYQDELLFYRLGDFYELFFEDAIICSRELGLTLTGKNAGLSERVPMCGVPHHSIKNYIKEAVDKGYKLAICEQVEDPKESKGMVKREVTEVISKGTMTDLEFLDNKDFNYLGSIYTYSNSFVVSYADISTGELNVVKIEKDYKKLFNIIINNNFKEVILTNNTDIEIINTLKNIYNIDITIEDDILDEDIDFVDSIKDDMLINGIKHLLYYLKIKELKDISNFNSVNILDNDKYLYMDIHTIRNLELFETTRLKERKNSLIWLIDRCKTSMGSRKLKSWMLKPLRDKNIIENRYDIIDKFNSHFILRSELANDLYEIYDIERLCGKVASNSANARDLTQLKKSLRVLPDLKRIINELKLDYKIDTFDELTKLIDDAIKEDAPISLKDGYLINDGFNEELDELRKIRKGGKDFISAIEVEAKQQTGINNLKVGYNKVFGYFIEVSKGNVSKIDPSLGWERKQTLVNAERFSSPKLKEKENMILNAEDRIVNLEYNIFINIRNEVKRVIHELNDIAKIISEIDALYSLSVASEELSLVRPNINEDSILEVVDGRHPVVEYVSKNEYVENDIMMDNSVNTLLITGPNMSGKSTYMRETAIIVILAQMGSFVPAKKANIPIFDKIFTRIGASDDLVSGESTFMVEMMEANNAIENATSNSLILFDELGRGTSTYDGMSIAQAILEYINTNIKCKTLFSTHYHELTSLSDKYNNIVNIHVDAKEENGNVVFLHKIKNGPVDKSYGVHVAKLSGMPNSLINRANEILNNYESNKVNSKQDVKNEQIAFDFTNGTLNDKVTKYISDIDIYNTTPREAMDILYKLKDLIK